MVARGQLSKVCPISVSEFKLNDYIQFSTKRLLTFLAGISWITSCGATTNMRERRTNFRVEWNSAAKIFDRNGRFARRCIVRNFSNGGANIIGPDPSTIPNEFILCISTNIRPQMCHVVWRSTDQLGVKFDGYANCALKTSRLEATTARAGTVKP